jgi:hypothetical protein
LRGLEAAGVSRRPLGMRLLVTRPSGRAVDALVVATVAGRVVARSRHVASFGSVVVAESSHVPLTDACNAALQRHRRPCAAPLEMIGA